MYRNVNIQRPSSDTLIDERVSEIFSLDVPENCAVGTFHDSTRIIKVSRTWRLLDILINLDINSHMYISFLLS